MKSLLNLFRLSILLLAVLVSGAAFAAPSGEPAMKMPVDGDCDGNYILFEGVCVLPAALQGEPATIMQKIKEFKSASSNDPEATEPSVSTVDEDPTCAHYRKILESSSNKGVMAYNPETEKLEKTRSQATESALKEAREYIINFCNE